MTEHAKRKPTYSLYAVKKRPRGEKNTRDDYTNICSIWVDDKYDASFRPECTSQKFADLWDEASKGQYSSVYLKIRGLNSSATAVSTNEVKHYAQDIINAISPAKDPDFGDDDVPF